MLRSINKWVLLGVFLLTTSLLSHAQTLTKPQYGEGKAEVVEHYATTTLDNGEVVPWFPIEEVVITAVRQWKSEDERQRYLRLKRNVIRVLPYAIYAQKRYDQLDRDLATANSGREEKRLIKECEREIKEKITSEVKNLTVSQGKILIKLIERQTGNTSYDLVKDMKGGVSAFVYQGVAKLFGHNLKSTYDPQEDFEIENIIREYERVRPIRNP
ncbi:DUF4294 domain-containing protein [Sphingobacterium sp. DK4209]|uniref:DUF4294 domain-containing protein n=1 Tax=Sphingobacterium zhuxiongii TaxID=2662364 RepID=A0A5Q0QFV2_9SPHI|nr:MULTISPECIES: DUF4294 domain-containing protein [unclassified Sphingobacterium]MVZ67214.1 DUF4294 domain-containing protein [Sphingobacterium sp. DK4209]QGA26718.1 DUF4294 domain-containing protein [Sphingobacterium sp. dk4302]